MKKYYGFVVFDPHRPVEPYCKFTTDSVKNDQLIDSMLNSGFKFIKKLEFEYMRTKEELLQEDKRILELVYIEDYYVHLIDNHGPINLITDIYSFWNKFWLSLPDHSAIRRKPFYEICDLIEECTIYMDDGQKEE